MLPWGIPFVMFIIWFPREICEFLIKNWRSENSSVVRKFYRCIFSNSLLCGTVSKALFKSMNSIPYYLVVSLSFFMFSRFYWNRRRLTSVPRFFRNPVWDLFMLKFMKFLIFPDICSSMNFLIGDRVVIGLMSFTVGVSGWILLISISLPVMCLRNFSLLLMFWIIYLI